MGAIPLGWWCDAMGGSQPGVDERDGRLLSGSLPSFLATLFWKKSWWFCSLVFSPPLGQIEYAAISINSTRARRKGVATEKGQRCRHGSPPKISQSKRGLEQESQDAPAPRQDI